ncbi:MAG: c-type cytochrome biogenesis protein CcmI, partial [Pseudomonadota bacterium]
TELDADLAAGTISREQWEAARGDLQRGLLEDVDASSSGAVAPSERSKTAAIAVVIAVPLVSVLLYLALGNLQGLDPAQVSAQQGASHQLTKEQIESMAARLAQRLESTPDDAEGWIMLARTYNALGRYGEAAAAFAKAEAKFPQDAQLLADYADTLAMTQGRRLEGRPEALIRRALKADANNIKALALVGTVEFEKRNFGKAIEHWRQILSLLPADSEMGNSVRASIQEAQDKLGQAGVTQPAPLVAATGKTAAKPGSVSGMVNLAPAVAARAAPDDTVFVLARPAQGSRMPLAATRVKVKDLPFAFSFDDSMAMNPSSKISDFPEVVVAARVSKSGNVVPQPGDLEGVSKSVRPGASGIKVDISNEIK